MDSHIHVYRLISGGSHHQTAPAGCDLSAILWFLFYDILWKLTGKRTVNWFRSDADLKCHFKNNFRINAMLEGAVV